jgi:replicative DNA helicase
MLIKPELIDILSADVQTSDFYFDYNRDVYRAILALRARNSSVDILTVADQIGTWEGESSPLAYCADLDRNTPSAANAKEYARIVLERSIDRAMIEVARTIHESAHGDASTEDKIALAQAEVLSISAESATPEIVSAADVMRSHVAELDRRDGLKGAMDGLSTGIDDLDARLMGLKPEQVIVIAGRAKMGKTTLAMNIATTNAIRDGKKVLVVSLEMSHAQLMDRMLASTGCIPLQSLKDGSATLTHSQQLLNASSAIIGSGLKLSARRGLTINRIRSMARREKMLNGLELLIIDHIGLVDVDDPRANSVARISEITRQSKLLAAELGIPVIILSQLNRSLESRPDKRPIPSDLRDSGSIEQDADLILFVYRDEVYHPHSEARGTAEIIIGVARDIEAGMVRVQYQGKYSTFCDIKGYEGEAKYTATKSYASSSLLD